MTLRNFGLGSSLWRKGFWRRHHTSLHPWRKVLGGTQTIFHKSSFNILYLVLFGSRYEYDDKFLKFFIRIFTENAKITNGPWAL
ncbi:unnamed protein product, partial [Coregonus sp. 'balchen']